MTKTILWSSSAGDIPADLAFKNNFAASGAPTVNDDVTAGYSAGSLWIYGTAVYICVSAADGAASWALQQSQSAGGDLSVAGNLSVAGRQFGTQAAPVAKTTSGTLTAANLLVGMVTVAQGSGANSNQQLPLGSAMQTALPSTFGTNSYFDFSIVNTGAASETATLTVNTNFTIEGGAVVQPSASATFRVRKTAANTFVAYRIAG